MRFALCEILRCKNDVKQLLEFRVCLVNTVHLGNIATGNQCRGDHIPSQPMHEGLKTPDISIIHLRLENRETFHDVGSRFHGFEMGIENLVERLPLDPVLQSGVVRVIFTAHPTPEDGILRFGVNNHTIQIEKSCLNRKISHVIIFTGAKLAKINEKDKIVIIKREKTRNGIKKRAQNCFLEEKTLSLEQSNTIKMKKTLYLVLLAILWGIGSMANAEEVVIDLSEQGYTNAQDVSSLTIDGITLTFRKGTGSNGPKYYTTGSAVRLYGGNTLTVSAEKDIIEITMSFASGNSPSSSNFSVDCGSATPGVTTLWTGSSNTVVFTNTAPSGHWRLQTITVKTQSAPPIPEVTSITSLRELADGVKARLTFGRDNPGKIEFVHEGDVITAYVRDNEMAVSFKDFLPDDAGWHTSSGGALIGSVDGEYHLNNGMPEFTHINTSIADSILCLDNWEMPAPLLVNNLSELADVTHRADYVAVEHVTIGINDQGSYYLGSDSQTLAMDNYFGMSDNIPDDLRGREFNVTGILAANEDDGSSVLHYTQIDEIVPELFLGENLHTNLGTIGIYDDRLVNIIVDRSLVTNTWNTLCLPFDILCFSDIVSSAKLAEFTGYNAVDNSLEFTSVKDLKAGIPYLVFPTEEVNHINIQGATIESGLSPITFGAYEMVGIYEPTTLYAGDTSVLFLGENNTLFYPNVTNDLKAFRAYFQTTSTQAANIFVDGVMSNITTATIDGQSPDGPIYNIGGQMVSTSAGKLQKGVYVKAGNKVVIR